MDAESVARSTHFAELLQRTSMASLQPSFAQVSDGGVRRAGFFVLAGAEMPAVLYEASFISNGVEEQRLDTASYRQKLADAIVNAVRAYRDGL
jgi:N-acetylmuramoyl-L-alanine amidase